MEQNLQEFTLRVLEYNDLKELLQAYSLTPLGHKKIGAIEPLSEQDLVELELNRLTEAVHFYQRGGDFPVERVQDPEEVFRKLQIEDSILNGEEVFALLSLMKSGLSVKKLIPRLEKNQYYLLVKLIQEIPDLRSLVKEIDGNVNEKGYVESSASKELFNVRKKIDGLSTKVKKHLEDMMDRPGADKIMQDDYITLRTGRYVVPVRTDAPFPVQGIIHGTSSTGHTVFVEPMATVKINNDIIKFKEAESEEIERILKRYTYLFRKDLPELEQTSTMIGAIDLLHAKAKFSIDFRCVCPELDSGGLLRIEEARHPLLERFLSQRGGRIVPISVELGPKKNALIVSGPNAGGKTVSLKTVGLLVLMAQSGLHVPAQDMQLPLFQQVIADIGDQQSITANLSTFSAHIENIGKMADFVSSSSLILIDEIGTGTDPSEGTALAVSIIEYLRKREAMVVVTTHHGGLKIYAYKTEGVINAAMEFDEKSLKPTYKLTMGIAGASSGIKMAHQLGLNSEIIEGAKRYIGEAAMEAEDYLAKLRGLTVSLEKKRYELDEKMEVLGKEGKKREQEFRAAERKMKTDMKESLSSLIQEFREEADSLLIDLKDKKEQMKLDRMRRKKESLLKEKMREALKIHSVEEPDTQPPGDVEVGNRVLITHLDLEGTVRSVHDDGTIEVLCGRKKLRVGINDCKLMESVSKRKILSAKISDSVSAEIKDKEHVAREINVIGKRVEEALKGVDKYLDDAYLAGFGKIRIIHGIGKGKLKKAIQEMLTDHPHVSSFRTADPEEGGEGATVADLKG
jgi:DNA mismatch repair protein MutS2